MEFLNTEADANDDPDRLFLLSWQSELSALSPAAKREVKWKIHQAFYEAQEHVNPVQHPTEILQDGNRTYFHL